MCGRKRDDENQFCKNCNFEFLVGGSWKLSAGKAATSVLSGTGDGTVTLDCQSFNVNANKITFNAPDTHCTGSLGADGADGGFVPLPAGSITIAGGIVTAIKVG